MIGKINAWRGKDVPEKMRVGGFKTLEELNAELNLSTATTNGRAEKPTRSATKKKAPSLRLGRRSLLAKRDSSLPSSPSLEHHPFNATAKEAAALHYWSGPVSAGPTGRRPSAIADQIQNLPDPNPRPQTADASTLSRKRSKTGPLPPWTDKPLPLAVDMDRPEFYSADCLKSQFAGTITRPRTSSGMEYRHTVASNYSNYSNYSSNSNNSNNHSRKGSRNTLDAVDIATARAVTIKSPNRYPSIPSITTTFNHLAANTTKSPLSREPSSTTTTTSARFPPATTYSPKPGTPSSAGVRTSILDEVEGTLSATITELQELQGVWHHDSPPVTPEQAFGPPPQYHPYATPMVVHMPVHPHHQHLLQHPTQHQFLLGAAQSGVHSQSVQSIQNRRQSRERMIAVVPQQVGDGYYLSASNPRPSSLPMSASNSSNGENSPHQSTSDEDARFRFIQQAYEEQRKMAHAASIENDKMKRGLEFMRARLAEFEAEKGQLIRAAKDAEDNLQSTLGILHKAKVAESSAQRDMLSARNTISILETRCEEAKKAAGEMEGRVAFEKENAAKLQAKLEEVNAQKVDLLERELDGRKNSIVARKKVRKATEEVGALKKAHEVENVKREEDAKRRIDVAERKVVALRRELANGSFGGKNGVMDMPSRVADLAFRLDDALAQVESKERRIESLVEQNGAMMRAVEALEGENDRLVKALEVHKEREARRAVKEKLGRTSTPVENASANGKMDEGAELSALRAKVAALEEEQRGTAAEKDALAAVLAAEMRRVAIEEHGRVHPSLPFLKRRTELDEAVRVVRERARAYLPSGGLHANADEEKQEVDKEEKRKAHDSGIDVGQEQEIIGGENLRERVVQLEAEIDYYLNDIVLYKLDVRGYKKDLRKAERRLRELEGGDEGTGRVKHAKSGSGSSNEHSKASV